MTLRRTMGSWPRTETHKHTHTQIKSWGLGPTELAIPVKQTQLPKLHVYKRSKSSETICYRRHLQCIKYCYEKNWRANFKLCWIPVSQRCLSGVVGMLGSCVGIFIFTMLYEGLKVGREVLLRRYPTDDRHCSVKYVSGWCNIRTLIRLVCDNDPSYLMFI